MEFTKTRNFRDRTASSVILVILAFVSFLTPDMFLLRVFFVIAGMVAVLEFFLTVRKKVRSGWPFDDRIVVFEIIVIICGVGAIAFYFRPAEILVVLMSSIANDVLAYFFGNALHGRFIKKKPFPKTSPKKSWEGVIGGYIGSVIITLCFYTGYKFYFGDTFDTMTFSLVESLVIIFAPLAAIFGDLLESLTKRSLDIKDSNEVIVEDKVPVLIKVEKIMTGHGGFADRLDSWTMVACFIAWLKFTT